MLKMKTKSYRHKIFHKNPTKSPFISFKKYKSHENREKMKTVMECTQGYNKNIWHLSHQAIKSYRLKSYAYFS